MKKIYSIVLCLGLLIGFVACDGDKEFVKTECVITSEQIDVSQQSATITSIITTEATAIEVNLQYAITSNFADYQSVKMQQSGEKYVAQLVNLQENTTYYIRYVASNAYSSMIVDEKHSFTTKQTSTHEYVDLGLSVKWATCNIGANSPEEYGDYFAWGEIVTKGAYSWSTYKWCNGSETTLTKYCTDGSYGTVDNKTQLELSDDAAYANWGNGWRMPTRAEFTELYEQCTWTWTTENGINGYKVTSKSNGNSIFLPVTGLRYESSLRGVGDYGYYRSSSMGKQSLDTWIIQINASEMGMSVPCVRNSWIKSKVGATKYSKNVFPWNWRTSFWEACRGSSRRNLADFCVASMMILVGFWSRKTP